MTKHVFEQVIEGTKYRVDIGWDRPLQEYYCHVTPWIDGTDYSYWGQPEWSSLFEHPMPKLTKIIDECVQFGLKFPDGLLEELDEDPILERGNSTTFYP